MPTYELIASTTLSSPTTTITFSSIPQTYTDLLIRFNIRNDVAGGGTYNVALRINGNSGTNYFTQRLYGSGSSVSGFIGNSETQTLAGQSNAAGDTANTFTSNEFYLANYKSTAGRFMGTTISAGENNSVAAYSFLAMNYIANITSAVTSIDILQTGVTYNFVQYSSAYLYGISNA